MLVTVGTTSFDGLIEAVDELETQRRLKELGYTSICYQIGSSSREIQHEILTTRVVNFEQEFDELLRESDLIISHMGVGTIMDVFKLRKKAIFVPNPAVSDNHQMQIFRIMDSRFTATLGTLRQKLGEATETTGDFFQMLLPPMPLDDLIQHLLSQ